VGWGRASSFGFSALGFERWQKPNVLDRVMFFQLAGNVGINKLIKIVTNNLSKRWLFNTFCIFSR